MRRMLRPGALAGKRVLVTGHTGFKGAWLACWLDVLGAAVHGFSLPAPERGAFADLDVASFARTTIGDVRDPAAVDDVVRATEADLVFHMAAQPLVRLSWVDRRTTFETNVMGTVNVLEAALAAPSTEGVVVITTDKVYENEEHGRPFRETDPLGGHDPYSASKAAAEIAIGPYRRAELMGLRGVPVVSVRAGNVIGGGDWSADRLVPDAIRSLQAGEAITLRRPDAVRPWQHVLDCVWGYLLVAGSIVDGRPLSPAYNFAHAEGASTVFDVTSAVLRHWGASDDQIRIEREGDGKEATLLQLDPSLAGEDLGWHPVWSLDESIERTVAFYKDSTIGRAQIEEHMARSAAAGT
jgi:CDP-glucose 4,6-dehydratase